MSQRTKPMFETMAELLDRLGGIDPARVRLRPPPGKATEKDLLRLHARTDKIYELVDGTLVEKAMGYLEGGLAADLIRLLGVFLDRHDLGDIVGPDATARIMPGLVRIPDVAFVSWEKLPNRQRPVEPIPDLVPDLAIEVLSESNTEGEMQRKLKEYFLAGVRQVWHVDPRDRVVEVFSAPDESVRYSEEEEQQSFTSQVLPGLHLSVRDVFARCPATRPPRKKKGATRRRRA